MTHTPFVAVDPSQFPDPDVHILISVLPLYSIVSGVILIKNKQKMADGN